MDDQLNFEEGASSDEFPHNCKKLDAMLADTQRLFDDHSP